VKSHQLAELVDALLRLAQMRARQYRQPRAAFPTLNQAELWLNMARERPLIEQALRGDSRGFGSYDNAAPVVFMKRPTPSPAPSLSDDLGTRLRVVVRQQRPRERRERRTSRTVGSRGDPSSESDDADLAPWRRAA
jgi:hypothetical protein